ncbi:energy-coupling factor transporter transmembrane component T family protein [Paenibacillus woosongensis]|uniref:Energy-coupling factor transporter transmembrane protein EcfT n=1 Tax=Paenibacillus woosongensis TaxID=307580 RepID=A0A7X2YY71_9BACL|nr:energy-coupling factor transporter transmembrane component T [Paenibacillus woosongensis]MUG44109.1 energy-coupling factor transporter transmembrane protein EcfT [Paenibacillus woosongensis]
MKQFLTPRRTTWLHRANPAAKLGMIVLLFLLTLFTHSLDFIAYQAIAVFLVLFLMSGHPPWKIMLLLLPLLFVFVSSSITMILFGKGDTLWWKWGIIRISEESFYRGIHIGFKSVTFAAEGLLYVLTTSSVALFYALMQKVKLAPKYAYSFMASVRLLPMVWEEFLIRRSALQIRGVRHSRGIRGWIEQAKLYAVPLLSQSIRRAHRVAVAMESKAFHNSRRRTYYYTSEFTFYDLGVLLLLASAVAAAYSLANIYPLFGISDVRY